MSEHKPMSKHSKKRNAGLLYEFLVRLISTSLVDNDQETSTQALKALKRFFRPDTQLYKEFRLINSLMKTSVSNTSVAASIIAEAKGAARERNVSELEREQSLLIRFINHKLNSNGTFWDQPINEYRMFATVQTLFNDWRLGSSAPLQRVAQYEDQLTKWLTEARVKPSVHEELAGTAGENRLVFKLMMKKLNEKYGMALTGDQKAILKEYVFAISADRDFSPLKRKLELLRENVVASLDRYVTSTSLTSYMRSKLDETRTALVSETFENIDDAIITKFMLCMKLVSELETRD